VSCGGVPVRPGDVVLGDDNGVLIGDPAQIAGALGKARESDDSEPALLEKIRSGQKLSELSAADALLAKLGHGA